MDRSITYTILLINAIAAIYFYIKRRAEVPLFLALFNIFVEYRLFTLKAGYSDWMDFEYVITFKWDFETAYLVSDYILLGSSVMMYCMMLFYRPQKNKIKDNNDMFYSFVMINKKNILYGVCLFSIVSFILKKGSSGYTTLTKLGTTSFILFFFMLLIADKTKKVEKKLLYGALFLVLAYNTYDTALRFQFLGWMVPIGYYLTRNIKPGKKVALAFIGIFSILIVFSAAGVLRYKNLSDVTLEELYNDSIDRLKIADDVGFIDGFMMMYQVYPYHLPYGYGEEHLNILLRPIPRAWWPGKPLASWVRNVEARHGWVNENSAGFSPTVWGVFYAEGGVYAMVLISVIWAWGLALLYRSLSYFTSDLSIFLVGAMLVSMIPIFRSGDMPGDFAIVLMSFWPLMIFVNRYKKFVKKQLQHAG